jgi:CRISPR-associated protein Cas5d
MKAERVSYDIITPSAARAIFEAIFWKPQIRWVVKRIEVLKPIRWASVRRNEIAFKVPAGNIKTAMKSSSGGSLALYIEDARQQRAGLFLRDVAYRIHADLKPVGDDALKNPVKYLEIFKRRAENGKCVNQPYLGCREFAARFRLIDAKSENEARAIAENRDLGWMLFDMDYSDPSSPQPLFFRAEMIQGIVDLSSIEVRG